MKSNRPHYDIFPTFSRKDDEQPKKVKKRRKSKSQNKLQEDDDEDAEQKEFKPEDQVLIYDDVKIEFYHGSQANNR